MTDILSAHSIWRNNQFVGKLTNHNVMSKAVRIGQWVTNNYTTMAAGDMRALSIIPINHIFGFMATIGFNFFCGGSLVTVPVPDPDAIMDAIEKYKPATLPAVPALLIMLLNHPRFPNTDFSCFIGGVFCGGSPLPEEILRKFEEMGKCRIVEGYGMSESCQQITSNSGHHTRKIGSVGVPWVDTDVLIVDDIKGQKIMPVGEPGEIIFRGPQLMREYWNNPEETARVLRDGWFYTGDIGRMDEDGFFYIVDRKKDIIISSGFNVFPREIDEVCYGMPEVQDACTIGVPHERRGEVAKAFIVLKPGVKLTKEEVIARCREKLAPYKVPSEVEFLDDLPRTPVGKPDRKSLRALVAEQQD